MHIGNAATALLAWLQVRSAGGSLVLRMEDIDRPRARPAVAEQILSDMRWLGLDWDEGPDLGGPCAPYVQSEREALYRKALDRLRQDGWVYPCFCSRAELLAVASAPHGLAAEGPVYPGTCRGLSPAQQAERAAHGKSPSLRFAMPPEPCEFLDLVAGSQRFAAGAGGDFVVLRSDGIVAYQLAVTVDDADMGITHVLRGWDLLDSTPRQLMLYRALSLPAPQFAHVPLLLGPDGRRLSKRYGSVGVAAIRDAGTAPETLIGCLAHLTGLIDSPEPARPADLLPHFDLARVSREPITVPAQTLSTLTGT